MSQVSHANASFPVPADYRRPSPRPAALTGVGPGKAAVNNSAGASAAQHLFTRGAYEISPASGPAKVSLFAAGRAVEVAIEAQKRLEAEGTPTRVVAVPCFELFLRQDEAVRRAVIGDAPVRVAVEAGFALGWSLFLGNAGTFVGMPGLDPGAPNRKRDEHCGVDAGAVAQAARKGLNRVR
ncbi:transketolase C-terminal domain-containing protein [uncultured Rhodoblastus sp.]|uniref:transketolase-like TK C-terminal-containing protein n=1 Tax=uncultured Rhodoblastus sp. TaxID=543037 RepID=UPI0025F6AF37|nr:transketolase C-terminal domain-containing protein [uncultured Rhodoblastus sp.]